MDDKDLRCVLDTKHIVDTGNSPPLAQKVYCKSQSEQLAEKEEIDKLLVLGLIQPSKSPWALPLLIVKKKDGTN